MTGGVQTSRAADAAPAPRGQDWRLLRFLLRHCTTGVVAGWCLMLGLVWTDVGSIGSLMARSDVGWLGYLMLAAAFGITGGSVGMGVAINTALPLRRR
ncbi:MAG: hypothetical protein EA355_05675 [Rhodobacteraceae bacterium]|nr:MAG: hypothetical protein EA355_05675 [Paracoccaceae bacterium]